MVWLPKEQILSFEEIARVVRITSDLGFDSYHLTGGEPLLRKEIDRLIRMMLEIQPDMDLALTTNGVLLPKLAKGLYDAGLRRINISLDTLKPHKFLEITRRDMFRQTLDGIQGAWVKEQKVVCDGENISEFRVSMKVTFILKD